MSIEFDNNKLSENMISSNDMINETKSSDIITETVNESTDIEKVSVSETEPESLRKKIENSNDIIKLSDQDDENNLDLFCYIKCDNNSSEIVKRCRGIVFNGNDLVLNGFPYTEEYSTSDDVGSVYTGGFEDLKMYESHEGTLIRIFYFKTKWYISTHRKLNAFKSKWASKESFGSIFKRALESEKEVNDTFAEKLKDTLNDNIIDSFLNTLEKTRQYMFLLKNTDDNCIVCDEAERPTVYHVGTFIGDSFLSDDDIGIPYPKKLEFSSFNEIFEYVDQIHYKKLQGVIIFTKDNKQFKIVNSNYMKLFKIRGNEPSIKFRYLQLRMNSENVEDLSYLYPKHVQKFNHIENVLYDIAVSIHTNYVKRFIKKVFVMVGKEDFEIIRKAHKWYNENRDKHRVDLNKIIEIMNQQSPTILNHLIRSYELNLRKENLENKKVNLDTKPKMLLHSNKKSLNV